MNQQDEDKAIKRQYQFPSKNMEMSWEFNPPMQGPENSTLLTEFKHHNSHGHADKASQAEEHHRQRN